MPQSRRMMSINSWLIDLSISVIRFPMALTESCSQLSSPLSQKSEALCFVRNLDAFALCSIGSWRPYVYIRSHGRASSSSIIQQALHYRPFLFHISNSQLCCRTYYCATHLLPIGLFTLKNNFPFIPALFSFIAIVVGMYSKSFIAGASLLAAVSAGPLPQEVATKLAEQEGAPTHFPILSRPWDQGGNPPIPSSVAPTQPTGTGSGPTGTAPASTGIPPSGGDTTSVNVKGSVNGPLAVSKINDNDGKASGTDAYTMYSGDGSTDAGWPAHSDWVSFDKMFTANQELMKSSCSQFSVPENSDEEISDIRSAIDSVALASKVDHRFILAIIMQESKGCVRVHTTNYGVRNPGLMQDHDGRSTCNDDKTKRVQTPCPKSQISGMIAEGTGGTAGGPGLAQLIDSVGGSDTSTFYKAARAYNSGFVDASGDLGKGIATHCYASDVANRLKGWVQAPTGCTLDGSSSG